MSECFSTTRCVLHRRALKFVELLFEGERGKIASGGKAGDGGDGCGTGFVPGKTYARPPLFTLASCAWGGVRTWVLGGLNGMWGDGRTSH